MIFVIDSNEIIAECVARAIGGDVKIFTNAIEAMNAIADGILPEMIFLDVMLSGPDGFTLLNEMISYDDTSKIPVVIMNSLGVLKDDLAVYGVVGVLNKDTMEPAEIRRYVDEYAKRH